LQWQAIKKLEKYGMISTSTRKYCTMSRYKPTQKERGEMKGDVGGERERERGKRMQRQDMYTKHSQRESTRGTSRIARATGKGRKNQTYYGSKN